MKVTYSTCGHCGKRGAHLSRRECRYLIALIVRCRYCGTEISTGWTSTPDTRRRYRRYWREIALAMRPGPDGYDVLDTSALPDYVELPL